MDDNNKRFIKYSDSELVDVVSIVQHPNYTTGRKGGEEGQNVITNITLHISAHDHDVAFFKWWSKGGEASAHYAVTSKGEIIHLLNEKNTAWTNGGSGDSRIQDPYGNGRVGVNNNSVTIEIANLVAPDNGNGTIIANNGQEYNYKDGKVEMNGKYYTYPITNEALDSTIRLVADIAKRNGLGELYHDGYSGTLTWHSDFPDVHKPCPGDYVKSMTDYIMESANMINEKGYYIPDYSIISESGMGLMNMVTSYGNPFDNGTIAFDMFLTVSSLNNIRNAMGSNEFQSPNFQSTSTIPASLVNAQSSFFGISSDLSSKLNDETRVIASIAQVFYDMDRERTNAANELGAAFDTSLYSDAMDQLINNNISFMTSFETFMFDPGSHMVGNTGKLYLSDLTSMVSGSSLTGALHENFESERENATKTKNEIDNLIKLMEGNNNFQGESWEKVKTRLNTYSELMALRINSVDILENAMVKALDLLISYMEDYDNLDDSELNTLKDAIDRTKKDIIDSQKMINATHLVRYEYMDEFGQTLYNNKTEYVYSLETRTTAKQTLADSTLLLEELLKQVSKIEGMPIAVSQAEQIINDALSEIYSKYATSVSDLVTGKEASYTPPQNTSYVATTYPVSEEVVIPELNSDNHFWTTGHVSEEIFNNMPFLKNKWGSYDDYLNGVMAENNPEYNDDIKDNGIKPGEEVKPEEKPGNEEKPDNKPEEETKPEEKPDVEEKPQDKPQEEVKPEKKPDVEEKPQDKPQEEVKPEEKPDVEEKPQDKPQEEVKPEEKPDVEEKPQDKPQEEVKPEEKPGNEEKPQDKPQGNPNVFDSTQGNVSDEGSINDSIISDEIISDGENDNLDEIIENLPDEDIQTEVVPPVIEIPNDVDEIVDITPPSANDNIDSSNETSAIIKNIGIGVGVAAAVGAASLGAHTYKKAKENDIYED